MSHYRAMSAAAGRSRTRRIALARLGAAILGVLALAVPARPALAVTIDLTPADSTMQAGKAIQYTATLHDNTGAHNVTATAVWSTGNGAVAIVSNTAGSQGIVTGIGAGQTKITAKITMGTTTISGTTDVIVTGAKLVSLTTKPTTKNLEVGIDTQYRATALYDNDLTKEVTTLVTWSSSNPAVATVVATGATGGLVHPVAPGQTTITATLPGSSIVNTDGLSTVKAAITTLSIDPGDVVLAKRLQLPLRCYGNRADKSRTNISTDVQWTSSNPAVASVVATGNDAGLLTALTNGTTTISAVDPKRNLNTTASNGNASVTIFGKLVEIHVQPDPLTLTAGKDGARKAKLIGTLNGGPGQTTDLARAVDWFVLDSAVADVASGPQGAGEVTGLKPGQTTLRATEPIYSLQSPESDNLVVLGAIQSVTMETGDGLVGIGETVSFKARASYQGTDFTNNVTDQCTWSSAKAKIATVDDTPPNKGDVTGVKNGTTTINATCFGNPIPGGSIQVIGHLTGIQIDPATFTGQALDDKKFHAMATYDTSLTRDRTNDATWTSSDPTIVEMDSKQPGLAHLLQQGTVTLTATLPGTGFTDQATVTVDSGVISLEVVPDGKTIRGSTTMQMQAQGMRANPPTPQDAIKVVTKQATWSSSDDRVARVGDDIDHKGLVTGGGTRGTATITATLGAGLTATAQVTINELLSSFELTPTSQTFPKLTAKAVGAIGHFTDGSTKRITRAVIYKTSNPNVVIVSNQARSEGVITGVAPGTATITAIDPSTGLSSSNSVSVTITP
jgi:uncharacterized protein YjdB